MTEEAQLGPSNDGSVMIDIGGDRGALVIMTSVDLLGGEIEITPTDEDAEPGWSHEHDLGGGHLHDHSHADGDHTHDDGADGHHHHVAGREHVAVRERRSPAGVRYAAIFPSLREGEYTLFGLDGQPRQTVEIVGGEVAELDWS